MGDVVAFKKKSLAEKHKGKTLCQNGHHTWQVIKNSQFDVKLGRLVTVSRCKRCAKQKNILL